MKRASCSVQVVAKDSILPLVFEAYQIGPFLLKSNVLFLLVGIFAATYVFLRLAESEGMQLKHFLDHALWYGISFVLGGRIFAMLVLYQVYRQDPLRIFIVWDGVFSFLGGCLGVCIALFILTWRHHTTFLQWLDELAPAVMLGWTFEWIGRFFGNMSYGKPTDMPWGITVHSIQVRYTVPIHPVQMYYAISLIAITIFLLSLRKRPERRAGLITFLAVVLGAAIVLLFEYFRGDFAVIVFAKMSDFMYLTVLCMGLGMILALDKRLSYLQTIGISITLFSITLLFLLTRSFITILSLEWRMSQFLAALAVIGVSVYVVFHRFKYPQL